MTGFQIQYYRDSDKRWCDSSSAPTHDSDCNEVEVWKAYVAFLSLAYPDVTYRLIEVTITRTESIVHV